MKKTKKINKEELTEDLCFECKDGGLLLICDHRECVKAYHPTCVGKDDSFLESTKSWICGLHSCFVCHKASKYHCYCCPKGICGSCIRDVQFAEVRGKNGFCNNCLKLALLVEEDKDVDSDGDKVDFKDRATAEFLFMEYWVFIKEKEDLNIVDLQAADSLLKKNENLKPSVNDDNFCIDGNDDLCMLSDSDDTGDHGSQTPGRRRKQSGFKKCKEKTNLKNKLQMNYVGWGSKPLIEFLASIGKDTSCKLSQYDVSSIMNKYIHKNCLLDPRRKKVTCDLKLFSVFGKKTVNRNKMYGLLEAHFVDNLSESEEDEMDNSSKMKCRNEDTLKVSKKPVVPRHNKVVMNRPKSCFAALVSQNFRLVYLKRSLIVQLLNQPDAFEGKVIGCFVRVKSDPNDYMQNNSHQLVQVLGVKKKLDGENDHAKTLFHVTNMKTDIGIGMLSDDQFREEECEDIVRRVKAGLLKKPTVVEIEQKARSLHVDITKHAIKSELSWLQNRIDQANEKGWRRELFEYIDRKRVLESTAEQSRLLEQIPEVIAEIIEEILEEEDSQNTLGINKTSNKKLKDSPGSEKPMMNDDKKLTETKLIVLSDNNDKVMKTETEDLIVLSDGEGELNVDMKSCVWFCMGPHGDKKGPLSLAVLRDWNESSSFAANYKVWRKGESEEDAVFLNEAICSSLNQKL